MVVDAFMIQAAISTFGSIGTPGSCRAGLAVGSGEAAAIAQNARNRRYRALVP